jgi:hypothetical protein
MRILNLFFILFFGIPVLLKAQDLGSWNIMNVKYQINDKWSLFGETQLRSLKFYSNFHYYEYKAGFIFQFNKQLNFGLGAGDYDTYREGGNFVTPKNNDEFRLWPQLVFVNSMGKLKVEHRYRAEFRFTSNGFRNRFRYRFGLVYNFGKSKNNFKPHQVSFSNELFFTNNEPYFERNRTLIGYTYKLNKTISLQIGYLNQFDYKINDETGRDFFLTGIHIDLKSKKKKEDDTIPIIPTDI